MPGNDFHRVVFRGTFAGLPVKPGVSDGCFCLIDKMDTCHCGYSLYDQYKHTDDA